MKTTKQQRLQSLYPERPAAEVRNPEVIEKFYKQIVNNFGYGYPAKTTNG